MTPTPGAAADCRVCQKAGARNGKLPIKYCDAPSCVQEGIDEGHITSRSPSWRAPYAIVPSDTALRIGFVPYLGTTRNGAV